MVADVKALHTPNPEIQRMERIFAAQKAAFRRQPFPEAHQRESHINRLKPMLVDNIDAIIEALNNDFTNRAADETRLAELMTSLEGIKYHAKQVRKWMKPRHRTMGLPQLPGKGWVEYQPKGVVGIIVPWNYPIFLAIGPLLAALAAGNRVMIKMSESTPHAGELLARLIGEVFDEQHVAVINGEVDVAQAFSSLPFDHLLFTGSTTVGKHIMRAAAANLTPVTLELGGKSPCIIGEDFPMDEAVERIAFGKVLNNGQTCVAPDYILCPQHRVEEFVDTWTALISKLFPTIADNPDFTAVINQRQLARLRDYLDDARQKGARVIEINPANEDLSACQKMAHTLILDVTDDMKIATDEIFGPLMMVIPYRGLNQAIDYVNERPRPLALYYMDWNDDNADRVLKYTHSGGVCINDTVNQAATDDLPFGGVGASGMGAYHGKEGFLTFSHAKAVYKKGKMNANSLILPPYNTRIHQMMYKMLLK